MAKAQTKVSNWTPNRLSDLSGKSYVITGGNSGIGYIAARVLGEKGADVVLACRSENKAAAAAETLARSSKGKVETVSLDLSRLKDVRRAAEETASRFSNITALVNNAGIMQTPELRTEDGHELQLATNHLGHFLWTGMLMDSLDQENGRVVNVSSIAHKFGTIFFDDLMLEKAYDPSQAYGQSKLANIHFTRELHRRLREKSSNIAAIACHPGYSATELQSTGPEGFLNIIYKLTNKLMAQSPEKGAIPTMLAAAGDEAVSGGYYGPTGFMDIGGPVGDADIHPKGLNDEHAKRLWQLSEELLDYRWA